MFGLARASGSFLRAEIPLAAPTRLRRTPGPRASCPTARTGESSDRARDASRDGRDFDAAIAPRASIRSRARRRGRSRLGVCASVGQP
mmetsp:Transcript_146/g.470  ORF Transcript_146/g.470 Transcript_146/m.470 type:complete len:88 (+) Transcript_146:1394-1657(+)